MGAPHHSAPSPPPPYPLFERRILVGRRDDIELAAFIDDEPCPAGAETSEPGGVDFLGRSSRTKTRSRLSGSRRAPSRRLASSAPKRKSGSSGRRDCCAPAPAPFPAQS